MKKIIAAAIVAALALTAYAATITQGTLISVTLPPTSVANIDIDGDGIADEFIYITADQWLYLKTKIGKTVTFVDMDDDGDVKSTDEYADPTPGPKMHGNE